MLRDISLLLLSVATFALVPRTTAGSTLEAGTRLEVRLSTPTGSRTSHPGDRVDATVIAPVFEDGRLLIPQGAIVSGIVVTAVRLGLGLKHVTSRIEYRFDSLQLPDRDPLPITARVMEVETAKERVSVAGTISGIYPTANLSSSVAFYALPLLWIDPGVGLPILASKLVIARSPDPEIYFPAGTEVILRLTAAANIPNSGTVSKLLAPVSAKDLADAQRILAKLPQQRTNRAGNHPSDLVNILFLGGREPITRAFHAAGWEGAQGRSLRSLYRMYHCMVQRIGYTAAPMGNLTLNGVKADVDYQKGLNTFSKRHHVRLWKQWQRDAWLGAATEDVGYKLRRMHLTHATDPLIDNERAKVLNDLAFTGCLDAATLVPRDSFDPPGQHERALVTDRKLLVLRVSDCLNPRTMDSKATTSGPRERPRSVQVLVALRNDLIRINPISLAYNSARALRHSQAATKEPTPGITLNRKKTDASESSIQPSWMRPTVLDVTTTVNTPHP
ncbi:MAG: LssY C-terminal domain-containing protein [Acidobacteriota bacterium]|nr:LssY C-terminal domain-containing protein [Acidobacteriota bacterium]